MGYQRNQISCIYRGTRKKESHAPSCIILPKTKDRARNNLSQWGPLVFQKITGMNFLYNQVREPFHLLPVRHNLIPGRHFQQNYRQGKPPGHLDRVWVEVEIYSCNRLPLFKCLNTNTSKYRHLQYFKVFKFQQNHLQFHSTGVFCSSSEFDIGM